MLGVFSCVCLFVPFFTIFFPSTPLFCRFIYSTVSKISEYICAPHTHTHIYTLKDKCVLRKWRHTRKCFHSTEFRHLFFSLCFFVTHIASYNPCTFVILAKTKLSAQHFRLFFNSPKSILSQNILHLYANNCISQTVLSYLHVNCLRVTKNTEKKGKKRTNRKRNFEYALRSFFHFFFFFFSLSLDESKFSVLNFERIFRVKRRWLWCDFFFGWVTLSLNQ